MRHHPPTESVVNRLWLLLPLLPALLSPLVLGGDWLNFLRWWAALSLPALICLPASARLFGRDDDGGYLFAKPLAMAAGSLVIWTLSYLRLLPFTRLSILIVLAGGCVAALALPGSRRAWRSLTHAPRTLRRMALHETLFAVLLLAASYARALKPAIESIPEKFMDYGYMMSLMRTTWLPGQDLWLAGESFNYYYYGQYLYTYLTKMAGMTPAVTYNLGMATTFALNFCLAYAVVRAWYTARMGDRTGALASGLANGPAVGPAVGSQGLRQRLAPAASGLIAAVMLQVAGNAHAFFYDEKSIGNGLLRVLQRVGVDVGSKISGYFFPDSTRYIGYNPDVADKTIHEFPAYSFLVADLHPHLVNLIFVLLLLGALSVLYHSHWGSSATQTAARILAGATPTRRQAGANQSPSRLGDAGRALGRRLSAWIQEPAFLLVGVLLGIFTMCNFWDLVIYIAVTGAVLLLANLRRAGPLRVWASIPVFSLQMLLILIPFMAVNHPAAAWLLYGVACVGSCFLSIWLASPLTRTGAQVSLLFWLANTVSLPFSWSFQPMSKEIALATSHSRPFQLLMLWGVHVGIGLAFTWHTMRARARARRAQENNPPSLAPAARLFHGVCATDLQVIALFVCGCGLILLPELVFVVDIYRGAFSRANTMFKFTYQAFVLLSLVMGYAVVRFWEDAGHATAGVGRRVSAWLVSLALLIPLWFPVTDSVSAWSLRYAPSAFQGLDATVRIGQIDSAVVPGSAYGELADDLAAIHWFNEQVEGQPVILEMFGKSYRDNCRISVFTGLPTVLGWETHEHLWRTSRDTPDAWNAVVAPRQREILAFYAQQDEALARAFLQKYHVRYIVVGAIERAIAGRQVEDDGYTHEAFAIPDERIRAWGEVVFERATLYVVRVD